MSSGPFDIERAIIEEIGSYGCQGMHNRPLDFTPERFATAVLERLGYHDYTADLTTDPEALDFGVWIDDPPRTVLGKSYLDNLLSLPLSHVAVLLDGPDREFSDVRWDAGELGALARSLPNVARGLSMWATPKAGHYAQLRNSIPPLLRALDASFVEVDCEPRGGWLAREVAGYDNFVAASAALATFLRSTGLHPEVTTFPAALRHCDSLLLSLAKTGPVTLCLQTYAVKLRDGEAINWEAPLGPKKYPGAAYTAAVTEYDAQGIEVLSGMAAYRQRWPGSTAKEAMVTAVESATNAGSRRLRWWSSKWLCRPVGSDQRHAERREALESLRHLTRARLAL